MSRLLVALVVVVLAWEPGGLEGRAGDLTPAGVGDAWSAAAGRFSLVDGVVGGSVVGTVDRAFTGAGSAICFLPGTFDVSVDGRTPGDLHPSSHCGYDATVQIDGLGDVRAGEQEARAMVVTWTDLGGRTYALRFDASRHEAAHHARVVCLGAAEAGCHTAVVDSSSFMLRSEDGTMRDTGSRAHLSVSAGADPADVQDLGVFDVPFRLTVENL